MQPQRIGPLGQTRCTWWINAILQLLRGSRRPCWDRTCHKKSVWPTSARRQQPWNGMDSQRSPVGQTSAVERDHPRVTLRENQASGIVAGNIGRLLFLIRTSGRRPCCMAAPLLPGPTCGHTQGGMQEQLWPCVPPHLSTRSHHICSEHCSWRGCVCHSRSQRIDVKGVTLLWMPWANTALLACAVAASRNAQSPPSAPWRASSEKQEQLYG